MAKNKILIVEDNVITAKHIASSLKQFEYQISGIENSLEGVQKSIVNLRPDLVLLDINLGKEIDGIDIAEILENEFNIPFVFLTSYNDESTINRILKLRPLGYVIKPFNPVDLNAILELALFKIKTNSEQKNTNPTSDLRMNDFLFVKNGRKIDRILISDIEFVRADGRYTYLQLTDQRKICNSSLKILNEKLHEFCFIQTHKSYLVNLIKIDTITLNHLVIGNHEIPVSKNYRNNLMEVLNLV